MVLEGRSGLMGQGMKENGSLIKQMEKGLSGMYMGINMKGTGLMIKLKVKAFILMPMAQNIKGNGRMICNMVTA